MAVVGNTELTATKNALIVQLVQRELISKAVVMPTLTDASAYAIKGAKSISIPRAGSLTVEDRASIAQASLVGVTYAVDTITLNQMSTVSWVVDPQDEIESSIDVQADMAARAAKAHAKNFDTLVLAGLETASTATTTAGAISKAIFLEMRQQLLAANADPSQLSFVCGPDSESALLNIGDFVQSYAYGSAVIPTGVLGKLFGVEVKVQSSIGANTFYMYDKAGYGFAVQQQLQMGERPAPEYGSSAVLKVLDMKWGHAALENSLLLRKDNN